MLVNLYGSPRAIPIYILDDGKQFGKHDYNWKYEKTFGARIAKEIKTDNISDTPYIF